MSTYLKTAAMAVLSKTLQTFLSKYLSDVDVEGVALPSVYDGSGWGVRLSNVKLREGVELMKTMPGGLTKTRKKKKKKLRRRRRARKQQQQQQRGTKSRQKGDKGYGSSYAIGVGGGGDDGGDDDDNHGRQQQQQKQYREYELEDINVDDVDVDGKTGPGSEQRRNNNNNNRGRSYSSSMVVSPEVMDTVDETTTDYYMSGSDDDDDQYDDNGDDPVASRPVTPVQQDRQSFLSCFSSKRTTTTAKTKKQGGGASTTSISNTKTEQLPYLDDDEGGGGGGGNTNPDDLTQNQDSSKGRPLPGTFSRNNKNNSNHDHGYADFDEEYGDDNDNGSIVDEEYGDDEDDDDDESDFEIEEEEYEQPVRLCLGADGRVGILDVRLIGKELHVMVEDADVTIEAVPILEDEDESDGHDEDKDSDDVDGDDNDDNNMDTSRRSKTESTDNNNNPTASKAAAGAAAEKRKSKVKPEPKRDTVGDRVLADNPLARLISSIPHLFLRDIRIRIIVRDQAVPVDSSDTNQQTTTAGNEGNNNQSSADGTDSNNDSPKFTKAMPSSKDTMVEIGIDFLSVTSGDDVLSHFHHQTEGDVETFENGAVGTLDESQLGKPPPLLRIPSQATADATNTNAGVDHTNEFLVRQIRTSRGPEGGFFVQIYAPTPKLPSQLSSSTVDSAGGDLWARQQWMLSTEHRLLRLSGLDILARIHVGTKKIDTGYSWFYGEYVDDDDSVANFDDTLLLFGGIDTVAPGPQLPLPPIEPRMSRGTTPRRSNASSDGIEQDAARVLLSPDIVEEDNIAHPSSLHPGADQYEVDKNGIQYCKMPSLFHRISRGMEPASCKKCQHLPSEVCNECWQSPPDMDVESESPLDSSMPMPGLVLQIGLRDPMELNIDRPSLETICILRSLFTKPPQPSPEIDSSENNDDNASKAASTTVAVPSRQAEESSRGTAPTTGFFSGLFYGSTTEEVVEEEPSDAFEECMQPEKISVVGLYLSKLNFRLHILKPNIEDRGLGFCYWDIGMDCLTIDRQTLAASEKSFQDVKLDVGHLIWKEYRGISGKEVVSLGLPQNPKQWANSLSTVSSLMEDHENDNTPWPSAACALLDIPPPLESMIYKSRERHGIQLRFVSFSSPQDPDSVARSQIFLKLGVASVDSPYAIKNEITQVISGCLSYLRDNRVPQSVVKEGEAAQPDVQENNTNSPSEAKPVDPPIKQKSRMMFTFQVDGGNVALPPLVGIKLPATSFSGERSSSAGIFFETLLDKLDFSFGAKEIVAKKGCPTLPQLASLPENVRMHILLCLQDLKPLEQALGLKHEKNSFRQIKSVDKGMLKAAKTITKRHSKHRARKSNHNLTTPSNNRRQEILSEIMSLDDTELSELWTVHQRYQRKLAKKRGEDKQT